MPHDATPQPPSAIDRPPAGDPAPAADARAAVRDVLARHGRLSVPIEEIDDASDLHHAGLTSLATVGLMLALEERFDVEFPDSLLSRKTFSSIDALVAAVEGLRARAR